MNMYYDQVRRAAARDARFRQQYYSSGFDGFDPHEHAFYTRKQAYSRKTAHSKMMIDFLKFMIIFGLLAHLVQWLIYRRVSYMSTKISERVFEDDFFYRHRPKSERGKLYEPPMT